MAVTGDMIRGIRTAMAWCLAVAIAGMPVAAGACELRCATTAQTSSSGAAERASAEMPACPLHSARSSVPSSDRPCHGAHRGAGAFLSGPTPLALSSLARAFLPLAVRRASVDGARRSPLGNDGPDPHSRLASGSAPPVLRV